MSSNTRKLDKFRRGKSVCDTRLDAALMKRINEKVDGRTCASVERQATCWSSEYSTTGKIYYFI